MTCSISFAGCGFLLCYHVGVAMCLRQYASELVLNAKLCSTSSGLLVAVSLLCDIPLGVITTEMIRITKLARSFTLGPLDPRFNLQRCLEEVLRKYLPEDAHERCTGRLFISLTRIRDKSNVILSEFRYREQLIKAVLAGCFIPTYSGYLPAPFKGVRYIDGSVTNNMPVIDQHTIRVSPFSGEADICPSTSSEASFNHANLVNMVVDVSEENLHRFIRVFIPQEPSAMIRLCQRGFDDALEYLQCNKRTVLAKSFFITSTFLLEGPTAEQSEETDGSTNAATAAAEKADAVAAARLLAAKSRKFSDEQCPEKTAEEVEKGRLQEATDDLVAYVQSPDKKVYNRIGLEVMPAIGQGPKSNRNFANPNNLRPVDLIVANFKGIAGQSVESREFLMRLPHYEAPLGSGTARGHVSAYFKRYLLHPVTQILSDRIFEASRDVLHRVNKRVNVAALTELLQRKRPDCTSAPEDIQLLKHILQMTNELTPFETIYYIEESNKIHVTELFDISDCEDTSLQTAAERELNQMLEFDIDDWGEAEFGDAANESSRQVLGGEWADEEEDDDDFLQGGGELFPLEALVRGEELEVLAVSSAAIDAQATSAADNVSGRGHGLPKDTDVEYREEVEDEVDPYFFSEMAAKALTMSKEYNEAIFGTFTHAIPSERAEEHKFVRNNSVQRQVSEDWGEEPDDLLHDDDQLFSLDSHVFDDLEVLAISTSQDSTEVTADNVNNLENSTAVDYEEVVEDERDPYFSSDMAAKAFTMSREYNELIFGNFAHFPGSDHYDEHNESDIFDVRWDEYTE